MKILTWVAVGLVVLFSCFTGFVQSPRPSGDGGSHFTAAGHGTNLWLSISASNTVITLQLHNTQPGVPYLIQSRQDLVSGSWLSEGTVTGTIASTTTPAIINIGNRTNSLFIQALVGATNNDNAGAVSMLAVGLDHILELTGQGDVVSWGRNQYGEFGDDTCLNSANPVHVVGLTNIIKIASGASFTLALDSGGAVWAWGNNNAGQLGDGGLECSTNMPIQVSGMTNVMAIAAHGVDGGDGIFELALAAKTDGTVWEWGAMAGGSRGHSPVQIAGITNAIAMAAGDFHSLALRNDGTVWAWGENFLGQLGNGTKEDSLTPVQVPGLSNIVAVCAGEDFSLALASNGVVWAWGENGSGQLGNCEAGYVATSPTNAAGLTDIIAIAAGANHSLAVDVQGRLWAWGNDIYGELCDGGSYPHTATPFQVPGMTNIVCIAAGTFASAILDGNGNAWECGMRNGYPFESWNDEDGCPGLCPAYADFYNGQLPNLTVLNGNNQSSHAGLEFSQPLALRVTDINGVALSNAPVSVEVIAGDMELRTVSGGDNYKGLRLTTDINGGVSLIGYADRCLFNTNCLVKVLAASRERIVEAQLNETLIPLPTINITSPSDNSALLVGTNQTLTITVDAEAAPGASIREVDYSCQTNGGIMTPLGISTQSPFSFTWTNAAWTNAFCCQYILSAVAVDNAGAQSDSQSVTINVASDCDGNGMPDYWELQYFGTNNVNPDADADGDGINNFQEYQNGTDPTDYYNGALPGLVILGGNDQCGKYDSFLPLPVTVKVTDRFVYSTTPLPNAPVTFTVTNGMALLAATTNDTPASSISLRTDSDGQALAWVYFPPASSSPPDSTIMVSASSGANCTSTTISEFIPLGCWRFDDTNTWAGEAGQLPLLATNVAGTCSWSSNAVLVESSSPAILAYNIVETNGSTNINCQTGSVLFWFRPDWSSANVGGNGPGTSGRLIELGSYDPAFTNGWWSLYLSPDGTRLFFGTSANGGGATNFSAGISWHSNEWYQIALTFSPAGSALYVDGQLLANGDGVAFFPNAGELTNGFRIGSDGDGNNQAGGAFDELKTFDYPLDALNAATCDSQIPDWWEIKYFGRTGLDVEDFDQNGPSMIGLRFTLLDDYINGTDPNVINFYLSVTNRHVNDGTIPVQINVLDGIPACMAVIVGTTNFFSADVNATNFFSQPSCINSNFVEAAWQPFNSNIIVSLTSGDGIYYVWVGLQGLSPEGQKTWEATTLVLDTAPPVLIITNPVSSIISQPMIQLQGYASESLSSLSFDVSNATGVWTNQTGFVTGQFYDTNLLEFTTNYFQCCDVVLTTNGVNTVTLHAADLAANTFTTNVNFTLDCTRNTNLVTVSLIWPQDGAIIGGTHFTLQGSVNDPTATVVISIVDTNQNTNVVSGLVTRDGQVWASSIPLGNGMNTVTITTTISTGNSSVTNFTVVGNDVGLTLNPLQSGQLNQSCATVTGSIGDSSDAIVVNGVPAAVNPDGTWEADSVPASPGGTATFRVEVRDGSGNPVALQSFYQPQPVTVGWMNYSESRVDQSTDPDWLAVTFWDLGTGQYLEPYPPGTPSFENSKETTYWTCQGGGSDQGYSYDSGQQGGFYIRDYGRSNSWASPLPAGGNVPNGTGGNVAYSSGSENYSFQNRVMIEPQDQVAAGTTATYLVQAQARDYFSGQQLPSESLQIQGRTLNTVVNDDGSIWGYTLLTTPAGLNVDVTPAVQDSSYGFNVQVNQLDMKLAVDNNRDGGINLDNSDATTAINPYRFWMNDSSEHGDDESFGSDGSIGGADDQIAGDIQASYPNNLAFDTVNGRSDVVNYFPVLLCLSNTLGTLPPSSGYEYHLVQDDSAVKFVYTSLTPANAFDYLTNTASCGYGTDFDEAIMNADTVQVANAPGAILDTNWLAQVRNSGGTGVILVEGSAATTQPLWLEIWHDGKLLAGTPLYLSIGGVEQMFRHVNFCYVNGTITVPARATAPNEPATGAKNLVFLPGYNVNQQEARGVESEMFKRFYWSGSKAKFYGVTWNGAVSQGDYIVNVSCNLQTNIVNALLSAPHFASFLDTLSGEKVVVAHSLGNMIALSAISDYGAPIDKYVMLDSAVAIEAIDGSVDTNADMIHPEWSDYERRLWATEWYQLFPPNDARNMLTWRDRFSNLSSANDVYNFYSSGEEVLRDFPGAPPNTAGSALYDIIGEIEAGVDKASYVWVWQEKDKGRMRENNFISSNHGGWLFNSEYQTASMGYLINMPPDQAALLTDAQLRTNPFFDMSVDADLFGTYTSGSTYAQANRDRILSDAIPALTLPVGANAVTNLTVRAGSERNFDMSSPDGIHFSAFQNGWPSGRPSGEALKWHHSDFDYVAYPFTYQLFNKIVTIGNLK